VTKRGIMCGTRWKNASGVMQRDKGCRKRKRRVSTTAMRRKMRAGTDDEEGEGVLEGEQEGTWIDEDEARGEE
jgi:hypothetical protein